MICNILVSKNQDCPACTVRLFKGRSRRLNLSHLCFIITTNVFRNIHSYVHVLSDPSLWSLSFAPLLQYLSVDASMTASFSNSRGNAKVICNSQVQGWWVTALSTAYCERKFHNVACASVAQRVSSNHRAVSWVRVCLPRHYVIKANAKKTIFNFSISRWFKTNFKTEQFRKLGHRKWTSSPNSGLKTCVSLVFRWVFTHWVTSTHTEPMERFYKQILELSYTSEVMLGPFL